MTGSVAAPAPISSDAEISNAPAERRQGVAELGEAPGPIVLIDRRGLETVVTLLPILLLIGMAYNRRWVSDDGFISLRIVDQILAGNGPVYNAGQRVEAATNPLWVAVLTLWGLIGAPLEIGAVVLGLAFTAIGVFLAQAGALLVAQRTTDRRLAGGGVAIPLGMLVYAVIPAAWDYATGGLETGLNIAWLGGSFWLIARCLVMSGRGRLASRDLRLRWWLGAAIVIGIGPLIRPDLGIFTVGFLAALIIGRREALIERAHRKQRNAGGAQSGIVGQGILLVAVAGVVPGIYQIFRMGYYAALAPNPAITKEAGETNWIQGWRYADDFVGTYALAVPLVLILAWWAVRLDRVWVRRDLVAITLLLTPVACGALHALFVVRVGGDFMHGRMLLPALFSVLMPMATVVLGPTRSITPRLAILQAGLLLSLLGWAVVCAVSMRVPYEGTIGPNAVADERGYYVGVAHHPNPVMADDYAAFPAHGFGMRLHRLAEIQERQEDAAWRLHEQVRTGQANWPRLILRPIQSRVLVVDGIIPLVGYDSMIVPLEPDVATSVDVVGTFQQGGIVAFVAGTEVFVVDRFGLGDPVTARFSLDGRRGRPGHEKVSNEDWVVGGYAQISPGASPGAVAVHQAVRCGDMAELNEAISEPLTPDRFARNVLDAPRFYRLRFSADPTIAQRQLCT